MSDSFFVYLKVISPYDEGVSIRVEVSTRVQEREVSREILEVKYVSNTQNAWEVSEPFRVPKDSLISFSGMRYRNGVLDEKDEKTHTFRILSNCSVDYSISDSRISVMPLPSLSHLPFSSLDLSSYSLTNSLPPSSTSSSTHSLPEDNPDSILFVSLFLPVSLTRLQSGKWVAEFDESKLLAGLSWTSFLRSPNEMARFLGCIPLEYSIPANEQDSVAEALYALRCYPVFAHQQKLKQMYYGFCKGVLWPVLHSAVDVYGDNKLYDNIPDESNTLTQLHRDYVDINTMIATKIINHNYGPDGGLLWIHGYQLMLVPSVVIQKTKQSRRVAFAFHTPFPPSDAFRTLPWCDELVQSVLLCGHIGFHLYEYLRHFAKVANRLARSSATIRPQDGGGYVLEYDSRKIRVSCCLMGVEPLVVSEAMFTDGYTQTRSDLQSLIGGRRAVVSVAYIERLKGWPLMFNAIENLWRENGEMMKNVVFVLYGLNAHGCPDFESCAQENQERVNGLNALFSISDSLPAIIYRSTDHLSLAQRAAVWSLGSGLICTPIREGINVFPLEFICVHSTLAHRLTHLPMSTLTQSTTLSPMIPPDENDGPHSPTHSLTHSSPMSLTHSSPMSSTHTPTTPSSTHSPLDHTMVSVPDKFIILSQFTAAARVLNGANYVNPWNLTETTSAYKRALTSLSDERQQRFLKMESFVLNHTWTHWRRRLQRQFQELQTVNRLLSYGLDSKLMMENKPRLNMRELEQKWREAKKKVLISDFGGTLIDQTNYGGGERLAEKRYRTINPNLLEALETLGNDENTLVYINSGRTREELIASMGNPRNIGLAAEEGFWIRPPHSLTHSLPDGINHSPTNEWTVKYDCDDLGWMEIARGIMNHLTESTPGSFIEQKSISLCWQFKDVTPSMSSVKSKELKDRLTSDLSKYNVSITLSCDTVVVRSAALDKGTVVSELVKEFGPVDLILCFGDDATEEKMFEAVNAFALKQTQGGHPCDAYSCVVGPRNSEALYVVNDVLAVAETIFKLSGRSSIENFEEMNEEDSEENPVSF